MLLIATYGSLRVGQFNHTGFLREHGPEAFKYVKTIIIPGFKLYSLGPFPAAVRGDGNIVVDLFEVSNGLFWRLDKMEEGAGYHRIWVEIPEGRASMWIFGSRSYLTPQNLIESGDWSKHQDEKLMIEEWIHGKGTR